MYLLCALALVLALFCAQSNGSFVGGGTSNQFIKQNDYGNFEFGYEITDGHGAKQFRREHGDGHGNRAGSYGLHDTDGRVRVVDFVADKGGFRAKIRSNEPGVGNQDSADAIYNGPDGHGHGSSYGNTIQHVGGHGGFGKGYGGGFVSSYSHGGLSGHGNDKHY